MNEDGLRYFRYSEFDSPDMPGSGALMDPVFLRMLDSARGMAGFPFKILSGYRTTAHNAEVGGVDDSSHTKGVAVDIHYSTEKAAVAIIACLTRSGFVRIGKGDGFIHVDLDYDKPHPAYWDYE